jgi:hypothetical protein
LTWPNPVHTVDGIVAVATVALAFVTDILALATLTMA